MSLVTTAKPDPDHLKLARELVHTDPIFTNVFKRAVAEDRSGEWLADNLAVRLSARWGGRDFSAAWEVARYLADEWEQGRKSPISIVNPETGLTMHQVSLDSVWLPEPVPRESGGLSQPRSRLRPDIESQLTVNIHDRAREANLVRAARESMPTELLRQEGSRQLDILTIHGRKSIVDHLDFRNRLVNESVPQAFNGCVTVADACFPDTRTTAIFRTTVPLKDLSSFNLKFDFQEMVERQLLNQCVQFIGSSIMTEVHDPSVNNPYWSASFENLGVKVWIVPMDVGMALRRQGIVSPVLVNTWGPIIGLTQSSVDLSVGEVRLSSTEVNDRWLIQVEVPLSFDWHIQHVYVFIIERPASEGRAEFVQY